MSRRALSFDKPSSTSMCQICHPPQPPSMPYAGDLALSVSRRSTPHIESSLTEDRHTIASYLHQWRLRLSQAETTASRHNAMTHKKLNISLNGNMLPFTNNLVTLDRSLTYKDHLVKATKTVNSRVGSIRRLAGTT